MEKESTIAEQALLEIERLERCNNTPFGQEFREERINFLATFIQRMNDENTKEQK